MKNLYYIIERVNRDKPNSMVISPSEAKEWIFEALRKIESTRVFTRETVVREVEDGMIEIPHHAVYLRGLTSEEGIMEEADHLEHSTNNFNKYYRNGRVVHTTLGDGVRVEMYLLTLPVDEFNNPLIKDDEYVISALIAYILHKKSFKMWMSDQISGEKMRIYEQEWLFYVQAATASLEQPTTDSMRGWSFLHDPMSSYKDEIIMENVRGTNDKYSPKVIFGDRPDNI